MRVFDASAVLAVIGNESGAATAVALMSEGEAVMSAVNHAEVVAKLIDRGLPAAIAVEACSNLPLSILPLSAGTAQAAGLLRQATRALGLSLGDRCCLAQAQELDADVVTADRPWKQLEGFRVTLIR